MRGDVNFVCAAMFASRGRSIYSSKRQGGKEGSSWFGVGQRKIHGLDFCFAGRMLSDCWYTEINDGRACEV